MSPFDKMSPFDMFQDETINTSAAAYPCWVCNLCPPPWEEEFQ